MIFNRYVSQEDGIILASVIIVSFTVFFVSFVLLSMIITESNIVRNDEYALQAFYLADAGTQIAVDYLRNINPYYRGELLNTSDFDKPLVFTNGNITGIKIDNISNGAKINSTAEVHGIVKKIELLVHIKVLINEDETEDVFVDQIKWQYAY